MPNIKVDNTAWRSHSRPVSRLPGLRVEHRVLPHSERLRAAPYGDEVAPRGGRVRRVRVRLGALLAQVGVREGRREVEAAGVGRNVVQAELKTDKSSFDLSNGYILRMQCPHLVNSGLSKFRIRASERVIREDGGGGRVLVVVVVVTVGVVFVVVELVAVALLVVDR